MNSKGFRARGLVPVTRSSGPLMRPSVALIRESETTIKIKFALFRVGVGRGAGRKIVQNAIFHGKRHDNKILKVKILLSRNFVVMAQAPSLRGPFNCALGCHSPQAFKCVDPVGLGASKSVGLGRS